MLNGDASREIGELTVIFQRFDITWLRKMGPQLISAENAIP